MKIAFQGQLMGIREFTTKKGKGFSFDAYCVGNRGGELVQLGIPENLPVEKAQIFIGKTMNINADLGFYEGRAMFKLIDFAGETRVLASAPPVGASK